MTAEPVAQTPAVSEELERRAVDVIRGLSMDAVQKANSGHPGTPMALAPLAHVLFTCNGRGRHLFTVPDHDAGMVENLLGPIPLAGAFCAGEIGPVGGRNFLHGFTASLALFA